MTAIYIIVGLLAGLAIAGMVVIFVVFLKRTEDFRVSIGKLTGILQSLSDDRDLVKSLKSFTELVEIGQQMNKKMTVLNETITLFYKVAVNSGGPSATVNSSASPGPGDSGLYGYDEEQAASREQAAKLRGKGIVEPVEVEITSDKAVKAGDV